MNKVHKIVNSKTIHDRMIFLRTLYVLAYEVAAKIGREIEMIVNFNIHGWVEHRQVSHYIYSILPG